MNSDVLRLDGVDGLEGEEYKDSKEWELIAKDQMMVAVCQVKLV